MDPIWNSFRLKLSPPSWNNLYIIGSIQKVTPAHLDFRREIFTLWIKYGTDLTGRVTDQKSWVKINCCCHDGSDKAFRLTPASPQLTFPHFAVGSGDTDCAAFIIPGLVWKLPPTCTMAIITGMTCCPKNQEWDFQIPSCWLSLGLARFSIEPDPAVQPSWALPKL